jgi:integrase
MSEGIEVRHRKGCGARAGGRCNCTPSYRAHIWFNREKKRIRKTFHSRAEAKTWLADARVALRRGTLQAPTARTLREAGDEYLAGAKAGTVRTRSGRKYKPSTIRTYEEKLTSYIYPGLGDRRLSELRRRDVQELVDDLAETLSESSVRNTIDPLRAIYRRAIRRDEVLLNPTTNLEVPASEGQRELRPTPVTEARRLLDALPTQERATWATAFFAGLRRGELQALRCSAVDLDARELYVEAAWDQYEGEIATKSRTSQRTVPLLDELRPYITAHLLATGRRGEGLIFGRTERHAFVPSTITARANKAWAKRGVARVTLHECRHTFASLLIASGTDALQIKKAMGHSTIKVTYDLYGHLFPEGREALRQRVDAYIAAQVRGPTTGQ